MNQVLQGQDERRARIEERAIDALDRALKAFDGWEDDEDLYTDYRIDKTIVDEMEKRIQEERWTEISAMSERNRRKK